METGRPSMRDIARILNISHATVSMALRNNPRISKRRREQVQRVAEEIGYRPDPMLSSLAIYRQSKQARSIAATLAWINRWSNPRQLRSYSEYDQYWRGAEEAAQKLGYHLEEFPVGAEMSGKRLNDILLARGIQGILIPPHNPDERWIDLGIDWQKFAIVRFGFGIADLRADVIGNDQMRSAELAVSCIHKNGYKAIGFVTDHLFDLRTGANFRMGYLRATERQGIRTIPPLVLPRPIARPENDTDLCRKLKTWTSKHRPDAIFTSNIDLDIALRHLGYDVPREIGLASTSSGEFRNITAGIDQNPFEIGRVAAQVLVDKINRNDKGEPAFSRRVLVEGRWKDGDSLPARRS